MMRTMLRRATVTGFAMAGWLAAAGCGALDVSDPTAIEDEELQNAAGAELLRGSALGQFFTTTSWEAMYGGLLSDELLSYRATFVPPSPIGLDQRSMPADRNWYYYDTGFSGGNVGWPAIRVAASAALAKERAYGPPAHAAEMLAVRGFATLRLATNYCPGFPINELVDGSLVYGAPRTTNQALERALADFDTAVTLAADSARILDAVRVGRAATLLELGQYAEAATAAAAVATSFQWNTIFKSGDYFRSNQLLLIRYSYNNAHETMADNEGGNGLDYISAGDPRVQAHPNGTTDDGVTPVFNPAKYPTDTSPITVASGFEARLIEAEAALATGAGDWRGILNALRHDPQAPAGLADLADPGTPDTRLDLLFRERAFWLYATGHRLGDMRRLLRLYGRDAETVFPTGAYHDGGVYGAATSLPFTVSAEAPFNPAVTGCTGP